MIRVHFANLNGLSGKAEEVRRFNLDSNIDLTLLVETWLSPAASVPFRPHLVNLTNNNNEVIAGGRRNTGGILAFAKTDLHNNLRVLFEDPAGFFAVLRVKDLIILTAYVPPAASNTIINALLDAAEQYSEGLSLRCMVVGDLNARMGNVTGDSTSNPRGIFLKEALNNSALRIQSPVLGKWTTFQGGGRGIPDILLANFPVVDLTVHEQESLGGSDHRPLTFSIPLDIEPKDRQFLRWNIRRLTRPQYAKKYLGELDRTQQSVKSALLDFEKACEKAAAPVGLIPATPNSNRSCLQNAVDKAWTGVCEWINGAAAASIGRLELSDRLPAEFWTEGMEQQRKNVQDQLKEVQDATERRLPRQTIKEMAAELVQAQRDYRADMADRRRTLFEDAVDKLAVPQNYGAFMRMVKGAKARRDRTGCKLDPDKMEEHAQHFKTTFGAEPTGQLNVDLQSGPVPQAQGRSTAEIFEGKAVETAISGLPFGKATGVDGIPAELFAAGGEILAEHITKFLQLVHRTALIPSDWRLALIVPVFKKKGSDQDIANYRPIALTCTARRLYERLLIPELAPMLSRLDDNQGGFRPLRSALDQAMALHEVLNANRSAMTVLMDIKAAYDEVDRRILWRILSEVFGVDNFMLERLQDLFDHNSSSLVIGGHRSEPIENRRGLLQGSSASPPLFNCHIHSLSIRLRKPGIPTVAAHGIRLNNLLFADDTSLLAGNLMDMARLLAISEHWSREVGIRFSPTKCVFLGPTPETRERPLCLYGEDLPSKELAPYLGLPFRQRGIDWTQLARERTQKARGVIMTLASLGMNAMGWAPAASANIYRSFIRPVLEYGVALKIPSGKILKMYESVQLLALRTLTSAPRNTSMGALHRLLQMEPFKHRANDLNMTWAARLHNSTDRSIPAVRIWRGALLGANLPHQESLPRLTTRNNELWKHQNAELLDHSTAPLVYPPAVQLPYQPPRKPQRALSETIRLQIRKKAIVDLDNGLDNVAGTIQVEMDDGIRPYLKADTGINRKTRNTVMRWTLGVVTWHEQCLKCGNTLSRLHASECSGAADILQAQYPTVDPPAGRVTWLDSVLNKFRNTQPSKTMAYLDVAAVVGMIYMECKHFQQQPNGFWVDPNRLVQQPVQQQLQLRRRNPGGGGRPVNTRNHVPAGVG